MPVPNEVHRKYVDYNTRNNLIKAIETVVPDEAEKFKERINNNGTVTMKELREYISKYNYNIRGIYDNYVNAGAYSEEFKTKKR